MKIYTIHLNSFNNFTVFDKKTYLVMIISNNSHFVQFLADTNKNDFHLDDLTKSISINTERSYYCNESVKNINFILKNWFITFFFKIKFNGKGFRIQSFRNKKLMNFTFGHSHKMYMHLPKTFFKRINKYKYFLKTKNLNLKHHMTNLFKTIKPINKYTLRGLRITRSVIVKRKGRKSPTL